MADVPLHYGPKKLLNAASRLNDDPLTPLHVPPLTIAFLHKLGRHCDHSSKPLGRFLLRIGLQQLIDQIARALLPPKYWELDTEIDRLNQKKELACIEQDWARACQARDQANALKDRLRQMAENVIDVQPDHFVRALSDLGFDQPLPIESDFDGM
ncbi:MAG TPA: hypothetical protein VMP01_01110 [Pirellulaceae bacterium]|nr:hypothetical protein [Pirellulaceae bacterium]